MTTTLDATQVRCRCCNQPVKMDMQQLLRGGVTYLVTCWEQGCSLEGFTFDIRGYREVKIEDYRAKQHPEWKG